MGKWCVFIYDEKFEQYHRWHLLIMTGECYKYYNLLSIGCDTNSRHGISISPVYNQRIICYSFLMSNLNMVIMILILGKFEPVISYGHLEFWEVTTLSATISMNCKITSFRCRNIFLWIGNQCFYRHLVWHIYV